MANAWKLGKLQRNGSGSFELDLNTAGITGYLVKRVMEALETLFEDPEKGVKKRAPEFWRRKYSHDSRSISILSTKESAKGIEDGKGEKMRLKVNHRVFSPADLLLLKGSSAKGGAEGGERGETAGAADDKESEHKSALTPQTVNALLNCLSVEVPHLSHVQHLQFTVFQYFALLDVHGASPHVSDAIRAHSDRDSRPRNSNGSSPTGMSLLDLARIGMTMSGSEEEEEGDEGALGASMLLGTLVPPLVSIAVQLQVATECRHVEEDEMEEDEEPGLTEAEVYMQALERLSQSARKAEAEMQTGGQNPAEADDVLSSALEEARGVLADEEEKREVDSGAEGGKGIPTHMLATSLAAHAQYLVCMFTEAQNERQYRQDEASDEAKDSPLLKEALECCDEALQIDRYCAMARASRAAVNGLLGMSELELQEIAIMEGQQNVHTGKGENAGGGSVLLREAAKDALAAFLLGGSSDLALAGEAEDAARQASRVGAKQLFAQRRNQENEGTDQSPVPVPKSWLVQAYLTGYEPIAAALGVNGFQRRSTTQTDLTHLSNLDFLAHEDVPPPYPCSGKGGDSGSPERKSEGATDRKSLDVSGLKISEGAADMSDINDINEEIPETTFNSDLSLMKLLPAPPARLCDSNTGTTKDRQAFRLLRTLITLLELAAQEKDVSDSKAPTDCKEERSNQQQYHEEKRRAFFKSIGPGAQKAGADVALEQLESEDAFEERLEAAGLITGEAVLQGVCGRTEDLEMFEKEKLDGKDGEAFDPCQEAPSSRAFSALLSVLHTEEASQLTGVQFDPLSGAVLDVEDVRAAEKEKEGEDEWEDCSDNSLRESEEEDEEMNAVEDPGSEESKCVISLPLRARLLNLCSIAAYLQGDATGAVRCLRASLCASPLSAAQSDDKTTDEASGTVLCRGIIDSAVKLGALLCDMDEREEAQTVLELAVEASQARISQYTGVRWGATATGGDAQQEAIAATSATTAYLHLAELAIHQTDYNGAAKVLQQAMRMAKRGLTAKSNTEGSPGPTGSLQEGDLAYVQGIPEPSTASLHLLQTNVLSLLGVVMFRQSPTEPDSALRLLREACESHPKSLYLLLCYGEVLGQAGDLVGSLSCFSQAHSLDLRNPLPFVNAARTYQQLNQSATSKQHLTCASVIDPHFALTHIDVAQAALQEGRTEKALSVLQHALSLTRHVSDICDVLTAQTVAQLQMELQAEGLYCPPPVSD